MIINRQIGGWGGWMGGWETKQNKHDIVSLFKIIIIVHYCNLSNT